MTAYQYASTPIFAAVNKHNPLKKISISDLQKIWNEDYSTWSVFNEKNIFSIHRFGMRRDDGSFFYLKNFLNLKQTANHFPLETSQQIITMTAANPNAISIFTYEKELDVSTVKLLQLTDDNGKNLNLNMPHTAVFLKTNQQKIKKFLKVPKNR
jgi:ABC-type phosphate transport system substrate-binding protein